MSVRAQRVAHGRTRKPNRRRSSRKRTSDFVGCTLTSTLPPDRRERQERDRLAALDDQAAVRLAQDARPARLSRSGGRSGTTSGAACRAARSAAARRRPTRARPAVDGLGRHEGLRELRAERAPDARREVHPDGSTSKTRLPSWVTTKPTPSWASARRWRRRGSGRARSRCASGSAAARACCRRGRAPRRRSRAPRPTRARSAGARPRSRPCARSPLPAGRVRIEQRATEPIEASASPRNPRLAMWSRSSSRSLLVAWAAKASPRSSGVMPAPVVGDAHQARAALLEVDPDVRRAGVEGVLDQLLDDEAGRSITSPAAIWLRTTSGSTAIGEPR